MQREDFVFTIGYQGNSAVVDTKSKRKYGKLSTQDLAREGLFRQAFCSALYSGDQSEMEELVAYFREHSSIQAESAEALKRLFGVHEVPDYVNKTIPV